MSRKVIYPAAPPVTVLLDPADDADVLRAALAAHDPSAGRITVHPTPAASDAALVLDILAALGKPTDLPGSGGIAGPSAWILAAAWILALPDARLTVLRAHLLDEASWSHLLTLRTRTGVHLVAVCHTRRPPAVMRTALRPVEHHTVSTDHDLGDLLAPAPTAPAPPSCAAEGRWITVPALAYLASHHTFPRCSCTPPPARHPYVPERAYSIDQIAHRLATRTAYPQLAGALATAVFTGAPIAQLHTVRVGHLDDGAAALALHDSRRTRRPGFTADCGIYTVPAWARPFLLAAANLVHLSPRGNNALFLTGPLQTLPYLTDFAERCRLRPPQPAPPWPRRRTGRKRTGPPEIQWYDGISASRFEYVSYEQWLHTAG
ncbi:hypothetical protein [Streptomyces sp. UNOB3_S3]|uniref:hypothetical protein n=1 Tax=Streptomyces sp. UNOB3_S3 TaxID=2871682 RepID=UPI001E2FD14E|nr:hypothetical protein [Streptomyces sp. UNOB3_S3]MCC3777447.1 hypothetical protein [Streptomyces sp. UNOB3_S3]